MSTTATSDLTDDRYLEDRIMYLERVFGIDVPDEDASNFLHQEGAVRWVVEHVPSPPNVYAWALLCKLAETQQRPRIAEGRGWRSEQISAIVKDIFMKQRLMKSSPHLAEYIWLDPLREHPRSSRRLTSLPTKASILLLAAIAMIMRLWRLLLR
jgi:hypothetical protein